MLNCRHETSLSNLTEKIPQPFENACVKGETYKLVGSDELYNLINDPGEQYNIAPENPEKLAELKQIYLDWYEEVKSESGFRTGVNYINLDQQEEIVLQFFNRNDKGWPVKVKNKGSYQVIVRNVNPDLLPEGANMCLDFGGKIFKEKIEREKDQVIFTDLQPKPGEYHLNSYTEGYKIPKKGRLNSEDLGYRNIIIRKQNR